MLRFFFVKRRGEGGPGGGHVAEPARVDLGRTHQLLGSRGPGSADPGHQGLQGRGAHHLPQQGATMVMEVMEVGCCFQELLYEYVYYIYIVI